MLDTSFPSKSAALEALGDKVSERADDNAAMATLMSTVFDHLNTRELQQWARDEFERSAKTKEAVAKMLVRLYLDEDEAHREDDGDNADDRAIDQGEDDEGDSTLDLGDLEEKGDLADEVAGTFESNQVVEVAAASAEGCVDANLADFQQEAVDALERHFIREGGKAGILCLPTGGGKTRTALDWLFSAHIARGKRVLWITHRVDLLNQVHEEIRRLAWLLDKKRERFTISRYQGHHHDLTGDVVLASIQTLTRRKATAALVGRAGEVGVVCFDEAHRSVARKWRKALERVATGLNVPLLGLTATPFRASEQGTATLQSIYGFNPIYHRTFRDLIVNGFLARPIFMRQTMNSTKGFRVKASEVARANKMGDLPQELLGRLARDPKRNAEIVEHWASRRHLYGKTLVFACQIDHAEKLADLFRQQGADAACLHSKLDGDERMRRLARFKSDGMEVLVNVGILTEGANIPDTRTILMARPTMSEVLYLQMIGRGARGPRTVPGKNEFYVIDCVDNFERHGLKLATGQDVVGELGESCRKAPVTRKPRTEEENRTRRAAVAASRAWMSLRGFDPSQYRFWGELRWSAPKESERSAAVFMETLQAVEQAVKLVESAVATGSWRTAEAQATKLDEIGALRTTDWNRMIVDCKATRKPPELVPAEVAEQRAVQDQMSEQDQEAANAIAKLAQEILSLPGGMVQEHCQKIWPQLQDLFPNWQALFQQASDLSTYLSMARPVSEPTTSQEPSISDRVRPLVQLAMSIAKVDGHIHESEVSAVDSAVRRVFNLSEERRRGIVSPMIGEERTTPVDFETPARLLCQQSDRTTWQLVYDLLFWVALADGKIVPEEWEALARCAELLDVPREDFERDRQMWSRVDPAAPSPHPPGAKVCAVCGFVSEEEARFCGECGVMLPENTPESALVPDQSQAPTDAGDQPTASPAGHTVKALSVKQPFASEIARGEKFEEYRGRRTHHRGELLICASKVPTAIGPEGKPVPTGAAVALVEVLDCREDELEDFAWVLDNIRPVKPFPVTGQLGLFDVTLPDDFEIIGGPFMNPDPEGSHDDDSDGPMRTFRF